MLFEALNRAELTKRFVVIVGLFLVIGLWIPGVNVSRLYC
jgi:hypothetical protein